VAIKLVPVEQTSATTGFFKLIRCDEKPSLWSELDDPACQVALKLWLLAWTTIGKEAPPLFVAVKPGGNDIQFGLRVLNDHNQIDNHHIPYIVIDEQFKRLPITILHESMHAALAVLSDRYSSDVPTIAPMIHTTAAITDRWTAFHEGLSIHLETLVGHYSTDRRYRNYFDHRGLVTTQQHSQSEYFFLSLDYQSYSQSFGRYRDVRDNMYAYEAAFQGPETALTLNIR
jgi:hypothetical protein